MATSLEHLSIPDLLSVSITRDDVMHIVSASFDSSFAIPPQVLTGTHGVGKSDLALRFAHDSKEAGKYSVIRWMRMDSASIKHEWVKFANDINLVLDELPLEDIVRLVFRQLRQYRYLLIYDGVESYDSIQPYLPTDAQAGQHTLITSCREVGWPYEVIVHKIDSFSPEESTSFIQKFCSVNHMDNVFIQNEVLALHDTLEGLPQSLMMTMSCVAASKTTNKPLTIAKILDRYKKRRREGGRGIDEQYSAMYVLLDLCIEDLNQREIGAAAVRLLTQLCSLGSSDCVSRSLLSALVSDVSLDSVVLPLIHYSLLVQIDGHTFRCPLRVQRCAAALVLKMEIWTPDLSRLPKFNEANVIENNFQPFVNALCKELLDEETSVPSVEESRSRFHAACDSHGHCQYFLSVAEQLLKSDGINTSHRNDLQRMKCAVFLCMANVSLRKQQCKEAMTALSRAKSLMSECYPNTDLMFGKLHYQCGLCHEIARRSKDALESFESCLDIYTTLLGETHADVAACMSHIGLAKLNLGDHAESRNYYERAMIVQRNFYQDDTHPKIAQTLHDTAATSLATGDDTEAFLLYRESLAMKKRLLGSNHPEVALTLHQIGVLYEREMKYTDALSQYDLCLNMKRKLHGENHRSVADELFCVGVVQKKISQHAEALASLHSSLVIKRKIYDDKHIEIARNLHVIGSVYQEQGKHALALEYFEGSMNMKALLSCDTDEELLDTWLCIASVYYSQGKYVEALKTFNQCLEIQREIYRTRDPVLVRTLLGIASVYESQGKYQQCLFMYDEALTIQKYTFGNDDVQVAHTLVKIAWVFKLQEKFSDSLNTYEEALAILKSVHGENHAEVASVLTSIGTVFSSQGRYEDALMYLNHSLEIKRIVYSEHHQSVIHSEEIVRRILTQSEFRNTVVQRFKDYIASRQTESYIASSSLGLSFSKEQKIAAAEFIIEHLEQKGLERINSLKSTPEYKKHQDPLNDGRLATLMKSMYEEFYSRGSETTTPTRARRGTIY